MTAKKKAVRSKKTIDQQLVIAAPNLQTATIVVRGTAPLVIHKFSKKARETIRQTQEAGPKAKSRKQREPRDFMSDYEEARHISEEGWDGIPAAAFRSAMISACKIAGFVMTRAKIAISVIADGVDADSGQPLVKIISKRGPEVHEDMVRLATGVCNISVRPMWREWSAKVRVRWDADMLCADDIANLLMRAGLQVGICEGRPDSKSSNGCGWGTFDLV